MPDTRLFSTRERTDSSPKSWSEPAFAWLDRSARDEVAEVRRELEEWFEHFPMPEQADLRGRFRSPRDEHHEAALFEMMLHEMLLRLGQEVEVHPALPETARTPDFLAHSAGNRAFYLEATVCMDLPDHGQAGEARLNDLRETLERIDATDFLFDVRTRGSPAEPISGRPIRRRIERDLQEVDWVEIRRNVEDGEWGHAPSWSFDYPGFELTITAIPRSPEKRGTEADRAIGIVGGGVRRLSTDRAIHAALERKAGAYGDLDHPFLIAVNVLGDFPPEMYDFWNALLGTLAVEERLWPDGRRSTADVRQPDGLWRGPEGPHNTRVSAVVAFSSVRPWNLPRAEAKVIENPWAAASPEGVLARLPRWVPVEGRMVEAPGVSLREVFGLPGEWPFTTRS